MHTTNLYPTDPALVRLGAMQELMREFLFDDETGVEADNSDLLSDDYSGDSADDFDYEDEE